jgi:hypothetical protein
LKKICVVTLNIEFDDTYTNPKDWQWDSIINDSIEHMSRIEYDRYYCHTQLVNCQYFDTNKPTIDNP